MGYTSDGNLDSLVNGGSITTLDYDFIDKLKQVNEPGGDTTKYYYDGNGLRIKKWYRKNEFTPLGKSFIGIDTDTGFVATGEGASPSYTITERYYIHSGPGMVLVQDDNTPNFLTNPSFEDGATGWSVYVPGQASNNWEINTSDSYAGSYCLKTASYSDTTYESYYQKFYLSDINLKIPFILSAYVKTEGGITGNGAQILVQYEDSNSTIKAYASDYITSASDWTKVDLVVDSIPPDSAIKICITLRRYKGNGTIRFDAVRFENGAERTPEVKYVYGGRKRIALEKDGGIYYYHPDRLGSVRLVTDENGTVLKRYNYTAFGSALSDSGSFDNDYRYTSQAIDENDLYYMHARFYDNSIGRFLSTDPFPGYRSIPSTMHSYNYCGNNPVNFVDPMGMDYWYRHPDPNTGEGGYYVFTTYTDASNNKRPRDYDSALWSDNSYYHFGHEDPDVLHTAAEVGKQLNTNSNQQDKERNDLTPKGDMKTEYTYGLRALRLPHPGSLEFLIMRSVLKELPQEIGIQAWQHREEILKATDQTLIEVGTRGDQPAVITLIGGAYIIVKGSIILIEDAIDIDINSPKKYPPIHGGVNFYSPPANATIPR